MKVKLLNTEARLPVYAKAGDAGMDLTVTSIEKINWFTYRVKFGIAIELPENYFALVFSRSSIWKYGLIWLSNSVGVIDNGYRGEIQAVFHRIPFLSRMFEVGERATQLVIQRYEYFRVLLSNELSATERGENGFGHTGK